MNNMHALKNNSILRAVLICLLTVLLTVSLCACNGDQLRSSEGLAEKSFRDKMADASVTEITVEDNLVLESPVEVSGNKVLTGEGSINAIAENMEGEYMIVVPSGSSLTVKGSVTIHARGVMGGVHVAKGATWTLEENAVVTNASAGAANALVEGVFQMKGGTASDALGHNILNKGEMTLAGGTITGSGAKHTAITNEGTLTQNGGTVSGAYNNISVLAGGSFVWNGGTNQDSVHDGVFVAEGATITITSDAATLTGSGARGLNLHGNAVIEGATMKGSIDTLLKVAKTGTLELKNASISEAGYHGIDNAGTMTMSGGQIFMNDNSGIVNTGTLVVTGGTIMENGNKGIMNKHAGKATLVSAAVMVSGNRIAIGNEDTAYFEIANAKIMQSTTTNIYAYGGEVYLHDISLGASNSNNVRVVSAKVRIENAEIRGNAASGTSSMHALLMEGGNVVARNVTISGATGSGLRNKGGDFKGENITIRDCKNFGISFLAQDFTGRAGTTVVDGLVIENVGNRNISGEGKSTLTITNGKLGITKLHNIKVANDALVILNDVDILGTSTASQYGILAEGGAAELNGVTISDTLGAAIRTNRNASKVTGKNVTLSNTQTAISTALGTVELDHLTTKNIGFRNISVDGLGHVSVTSGTLCATTGHNTKVSGEGSVALSNTVIQGATESGQYGILVEGGSAAINGVTLNNCKGAGIRTNRGTSVITGSDLVINGATNAVSASSGKIVINGLTTKNVSERNIAASNKADLNISGADLCITVNHSIKSDSEAVVVLKNSIIRGATGAIDGNQYSVLAEDGAVKLYDVTIFGSPDAAIRVNRDGSSVTGSNVKIDGGVYAISAQKGSIDISGLVTMNIADRNINLEGNCKVTITNGDLCMTKNHNVKAAEAGVLTLNATIIRGTSNSAFGVAAEFGGKVVLNDVSIIDADKAAIFANNKGSSVTGTHVTVENTDYAITVDFNREEFPDDGYGTVSIDGLTTVNVATRNISVANGGEVTIINGDLCQTPTHSIKVSAEGKVTLQKTLIRGVTGPNQHGLLAEGGDASLTNVTIQDCTNAAIRVNREASTVNGKNVTVSNVANALSLDNGEIVIDGLTTSGDIGRNIAGTTAGKVTVKNGDLGKTTTHSVKVEGEVLLELSDSLVHGVKDSSLYGILAEGGDAKLSNVTIEGCNAAALRVNRDASEVTGSNITFRNSDLAISISAGKITLDDSLILVPRNKIGIQTTGSGNVTLNDSKVTGGKYAVVNDASFVMNGGEMFNSIWSLRNGETGTATLSNAYFYGNAEGTLPSDIHNAGKLIIDDITVGYNRDGVGSSGVIYQTATAAPVVMKGNTMGGHTYTKPLILVAENWERLWNVRQTIAVCDDMDSAYALKVNVQPGKNEPKLYISVRGDTLELTTQEGGNFIVKIGEVRFESFAEAFAYMKAKNMTAATIQVVDSFKHFETVEIPAGYDITLVDDGDAHRVITNDTDGHMFTVGQNAKLTIKSTNGSDPSTGLEFNGAKKEGKAVLYVNGGEAVIADDLTITNAAYGVWVADGSLTVSVDAALNVTSATCALYATGGTALIDELNVSGGHHTMMVDGAGAEITVNGGTFGKTTSNSVNCALGVVKLNGVMIEGTNPHNNNIHAIYAYGGDVELTNVSISGADCAAIRISNADSTVTVIGADVTGCEHAAWVSAGKLVLSGTVNVDGTAKDSLNIAGGEVNIAGDLTIRNTTVYGINITGGKLTTEAGSTVLIENVKDGIHVGNAVLIANGTVTVKNATQDGLRVDNANAEVTINEFNTENMGSRGAWIDNSKFVTIQGGHLNGSGNAALLIKRGTLTVTNVTVENAKSNCAIRVGDGTVNSTNVHLIATNLTVKNCNVNALNLSHGTMTIDNLNVENIKGQIISMWAGAQVTIKNSTLSNTGTTQVINITGGTLCIDGVTVNGATGSNAVYLSGNASAMHLEGNLTVNGADYALLAENGASVTADANTKFTISNANYGIGVHTGANVKLDKLETSSVSNAVLHSDHANNVLEIGHADIAAGAQNSILCSAGRITVNGGTLGKTTSNNVAAAGGVIELNNVTISGTNTLSSGNLHAVFAYGGDVQLKNVKISGADCAAIRITSAESTVEANNVDITGGENALWQGDGTLKLSGKTTVDGTSKHAFSVAKGSVEIAGTLEITNGGSRGFHIENGTVDVADKSTISVNVKDIGIYVTGANGSFLADGADISLSIQSNVESIWVKAGAVTITGYKNNDKNSVVLDGGNKNLLTDGGSITVSNATLEYTTSHNVHSKGGMITLTDSKITGSGNYGLLAEAGDAKFTNVEITGCNDGIRVNKETSTVTATNVTISNSRRHGMSLTNKGELIVNGATITGAAQHSIFVESAGGTLNISGLINAEIYSEATLPVNVTGALDAASDITVGWKTVPSNLIAVTFKDAAVMNASKCIKLSSDLADEYLLYYDDADLNAKLVPFVVTTGEQLTDLIAAAKYYGMTTLTAKVGGNFTVANQVSIPAGMQVTISDDGDAATGNTITYNGTNSDIFGLTSGGKLALKNITIDGNSKGRLAVPAGATVTVSDVTVKNGLYEENSVNGTNSCGVSVRGTLLIDGNLTVDSAKGAKLWSMDVQGSGKVQPAEGAEAHLTITNGAIGLIAWGTADIDLTSFTSSGLTSNHLYIDGDDTKKCNVNIGTVNITGGSDSIKVLEGSDLTINGGTITGSTSNGILVDRAATVKVSDIQITNVKNYGVLAKAGEVEILGTVDTEGNKSVTFSGNNKNIGTSGSGKITVKNAKFEKTTSNSVQADGGNVFLTNIDILGTNTYHGVAAQGGDVALTNVNISGAADAAIRVNNANSTVTVKDVVATGNTNYGISMSNGEITGSNVTISGGKNGIKMTGGTAELTGTLKISNTANEGIRIEAGATFDASGATEVTVDTVTNAVDGVANYGIFKAKNLTVKNTGGTAIQNYGGTMELTNVTTSGMAKWHSLKNTSNGTTTINGATFGKSPSNNVFIDSGKLVLKGAVIIEGTNANDGINMDGNDTTIELHGSLEIKDVKRYGLHLKTGTFTAMNGSSVEVTSAGTAVEINNAKSVTLRNVTATCSGTSHAVKVYGTSVASIYGLTAKSSANNVRLMNTATLDLYGDVVIDGGTNGIYMDGTTTVIIHDGITVKNVTENSITNGATGTTLQLAGELNIKSIYSKVAWAPEIIGAITSDGTITVDWADGAAPTGTAIQFKDAETMAVSRNYIALGAVQSAAGNYLAYNTADFAAYVKAPVQAADSAALAAALAAASADENTVIELTGTGTYQVSTLAVGSREVTIIGNGTTLIKTTMTAAGEMTGLTSGGSLTLEGVTLDGNGKKGYIAVSSGAVLNVKDVTFQNLGAIASRSIDVNGGKMHMSGDIVINNATYALAVQANGSITSDPVSKLTISNANYGVVLHGANTSIQIANLVTGTIVNENVYIDNASGVVTIDQADLSVPTNTTNHHSIRIIKGTLKLNNAKINGTKNGYGIFVETANSKLYGDNIYITGTSTTGLEVRSGFVDVSNLTFTGLNGSHSIKMSGTADVTITNASLAKTKSNNINVDGGSLTLKGTISINGTNSNNGIRLNAGTTLAVDGTLEIKNVAGHGIYAEGKGTVKVAGKLNTAIRFNTASALTVTDTLTEGSAVTVDWSNGLAPNPAITFASDEVMNASKKYIMLGETQATTKELTFAEAKATLTDKQ